MQVYIFNILMSANICNVKLNLSELSLGGMIWGKFYNVKQAGQSDVPWHSRTVPDILISYNMYIKGVSCPTVHGRILPFWPSNTIKTVLSQLSHNIKTNLTLQFDAIRFSTSKQHISQFRLWGNFVWPPWS